MSQKVFPVPCDDCGAEVGNPCMEGCPRLDSVDQVEEVVDES